MQNYKIKIKYQIIKKYNKIPLILKTYFKISLAKIFSDPTKKNLSLNPEIK